MSENINIQLDAELREYVDEKTFNGLTPSDYVKGLIKADREKDIVDGIIHGLRDIREGRVHEITAMDILNEK